MRCFAVTRKVMGITPKFSQGDVSNRFSKFIEVVEKRQIQRLQYLGEMCVKHAREVPAAAGFNDITGNLRSSIGYVVFKNGIAVKELYNITLEGAQGAQKGLSLAKRVGSKYTSGIALVVTAGMDYAIYVESKGKDVLSSAEMLAKQELPRMVQELKDNIKKATEG